MIVSKHRERQLAKMIPNMNGFVIRLLRSNTMLRTYAAYFANGPRKKQQQKTKHHAIFDIEVIPDRSIRHGAIEACQSAYS